MNTAVAVSGGVAQLMQAMRLLMSCSFLVGSYSPDECRDLPDYSGAIRQSKKAS